MGEDGKLEIWSDCPMLVYKTDYGNTLIYDKTTTSALSSNNYDSTGWGEDGCTLLKYDKVILGPYTI